MGDMAEVFNDWNEQKKAKKKSNLEHSTQMLIDNGIEFTSKNGGVHLIIEANFKFIDFWPSTGKFIVRGGREGRGIRILIKEIK